MAPLCEELMKGATGLIAALSDHTGRYTLVSLVPENRYAVLSHGKGHQHGIHTPRHRGTPFWPCTGARLFRMLAIGSTRPSAALASR